MSGLIWQQRQPGNVTIVKLDDQEVSMVTDQDLHEIEGTCGIQLPGNYKRLLPTFAETIALHAGLLNFFNARASL